MTKRQKVTVPKRDAIIANLHGWLNEERKNCVEIGRLLCRLKDEVEHGQFLPTLARELSMSDRTARNYMGAHLFLVHVATPLLKSEKFSDLKLRPSALYILARMYHGVDADFEFDKPAEFPDDDRVIEVVPDDIQAILAEARDRWVGTARVVEILRERHPPEPEPVPWPHDDAAEPAESAEPDAEPEPSPDDRPPDPNPERAPSQRGKSDLEKFAEAVVAFKKTLASSVKNFVDADVADADVQTVIDSLCLFLAMRQADRKASAAGNDVPTEQSAEERKQDNEALAAQEEAA